MRKRYREKQADGKWKEGRELEKEEESGREDGK